jgi:hypothetical protein
VPWPDTAGAPVRSQCGGLGAYECRRPKGAALPLQGARRKGFLDYVRLSNGEQVNRLAGVAMNRGKSMDFRGYWQRILRTSGLTQCCRHPRSQYHLVSERNLRGVRFLVGSPHARAPAHLR